MRLLSLLAALPCLLALAACTSDSNTAPPPSPAPAPSVAASDLAPTSEGKVQLSEEEWRARLKPEQYATLRASCTEAPFTGAYWKTDGKPGVYRCAGCQQDLFDASAKFDSGTGWPSFSRLVASDRVIKRVDTSHGMVRTEILCSRCEGHLGHLFEGEGPAPERVRYCMNSAALHFVPAPEIAPAVQTAKPEATTAK